MVYKIWFGTAQTDAEFAALRPFWGSRPRETLHDALFDAMTINDKELSFNGRTQVVWEIEGDDGTRMNRQEVADIIRRRRHELLANPPQTF